MLTLAEPTRIVGSAARLTVHPLQVKRRDLCGGLLHEYEAGMTIGFVHPTGGANAHELDLLLRVWQEMQPHARVREIRR